MRARRAWESTPGVRSMPVQLLTTIFRICRRRLVFWTLLLLAKLVVLFLLFCITWRLIQITSNVLLPPPPPDNNLEHFRRNRSLAHYLENINILIEPSVTPCTGDDIPVIILVTSAPQNYHARNAIRSTWAKHQPTYFILGVCEKDPDDILADNYLEAKQYSDMIVYDFGDHYQNLTLKTALMIQWTLTRCYQAKFLLKTDDDVFVNPWTLQTVLSENPDAKLVGYKHIHSVLHRDEYNKWYVPRWIYLPDRVPEFLAGPAYVINGDYLEVIMKKALRVPMINIEDVYFSYVIAHENLGLALTHDRRINPYRPFFAIGCVYGGLATAHSFTPEQIISAWRAMETSEGLANSNGKICKFLGHFIG